MPVVVEIEESLAAKFATLFPQLDERQRRLTMGAEARVLGHGGVALVARAAGVSRITVTGGVQTPDPQQLPYVFPTDSRRQPDTFRRVPAPPVAAMEPESAS